MKFSKILIMCIFWTLLLSLNAQAKQKVIVSEDNKEVNINFKDLQINDFIKLVSNILNKNILLQSPIPGNVDFVSTTPVYQNDLPTILQSVLGSKGYSLVDRGSFLEVVRSRDAAKFNLPLVRKAGDSYMQMVTKIIAVKNVNVDFMASKIKHLGSSSASIVTIKDSNSILITDFPKNIQTIENVIRKIERGDQKRTAFFKLKNADVSYIYPSLLSIVKSRFDNRVETQKVTIAADKASNTIIGVGNPTNLANLKIIIDKFDVKGAMPEKETKVIPLKNTESKDVLNVINQVIKSKRNTNPASTAIVVAEPNTNSIVITGVKEDIEDIKLILEELDKEQRQVYVKARIIEVSQDLSNQLGIKYGLQLGKANSSGLYTMAMNMGGPSVAIDFGSLGIKIPELKSGLALGAAIDFLSSNGAARVVSEPSILCLNNKESKIYVGQTQSIVTSSRTKENTTDLSTNTYSREDIGLTLKIKPRISNDGKVTLEADTTIEDVVKSSTAQVGMPTTTKRQVTTKAIVQHGESVIVGGLIRDKYDETKSKVPLLGDIPIVGELFKHNYSTNDNSNIVIILTPYIIDVSEDLTTLRKRLVELDNIQTIYSKEFENNLKHRQNKRVTEIENKIEKSNKDISKKTKSNPTYREKTYEEQDPFRRLIKQED